MLSIFGILLFLPHLFALDPYTKYTQLNLPPGPFGPDSVALDRFNQGPYVGVSDGRVLKYNGPNVGFIDYAYTAPNRTKQLCDGVTDPNLGPTCGRPLGFSFNSLTGFLYIVDTYVGLFKVGPEGGQATLLANNANGVPFIFLDGIDVDPLTGIVYFSDASLQYSLKDLQQGKTPPLGDSTGRLMKYDPMTKQVNVLLQGLTVPTGPAISIDRSFVLVSLTTTQQVLKYWLVGPKAGTTEVLLRLPGQPLKIKKAPKFGEFWVAVNQIIQQTPRIVKPFGYKFNSNGEILLIKDLGGQYPNTQVNVLQEYNGGTIYVGSRIASYVGIYSIW